MTPTNGVKPTRRGLGLVSVSLSSVLVLTMLSGAVILFRGSQDNSAAQSMISAAATVRAEFRSRQYAQTDMISLAGEQIGDALLLEDSSLFSIEDLPAGTVIAIRGEQEISILVPGYRDSRCSRIGGKVTTLSPFLIGTSCQSLNGQDFLVMNLDSPSRGAIEASLVTSIPGNINPDFFVTRGLSHAQIHPTLDIASFTGTDIGLEGLNFGGRKFRIEGDGQPMMLRQGGNPTFQNSENGQQFNLDNYSSGIGDESGVERLFAGQNPSLHRMVLLRPEAGQSHMVRLFVYDESGQNVEWVGEYEISYR